MDVTDGAAVVPPVLWLTGLSGAGKSTIAQHLASRLRADGRPFMVLDGDALRRGLNKDLGFTDADRAENVRRVAEVAHLVVDAGLVAVVALISPFLADRAQARALFQRGQFIEIFVDTSLALAESRDPKGLYRRARQGQLAAFTGISSPYEPPRDAEITIDTAVTPPEVAADRIVAAAFP